MEVCSAVSGETLAFCNADEFAGKPAKMVKQLLATQLGISRFRLRLLVGDASRTIPDEEVFAALPPTVLLVFLEFQQPEEDTAVQEMISACVDNQPDALETLLRRPTNPDLKDEDGRTPMHYAAEYGHLNLVQLLLEADSDKDASDNLRVTPLLFASYNGHIEVVRLLIAAGANTNQATTPDGTTPLYLASAKGHLEVVRLLIAAGANPDQAATDSETPLYVASAEGHLEVVRLLIAAGANTDQAPTTHGATPLYIAFQNGHFEVAGLLRANRQRRS
eukprot:Skav220471  [mRNA]  locus=scaffold96:135473:136303:+ [translate_table: standard]